MQSYGLESVGSGTSLGFGKELLSLIPNHVEAPGNSCFFSERKMEPFPMHAPQQHVHETTACVPGPGQRCTAQHFCTALLDCNPFPTVQRVSKDADPKEKENIESASQQLVLSDSFPCTYVLTLNPQLAPVDPDGHEDEPWQASYFVPSPGWNGDAYCTASKMCVSSPSSPYFAAKVTPAPHCSAADTWFFVLNI